MTFRKLVLLAPLRLRLQSVIGTRCYCKKSVLETAEEEPIFLEDEAASIVESERKRDKSRLNPEHRNILLGQRPYNESMAWFHDTVKYKKRMLGRYGMGALDVPAGMAWPTPQEVEEAKEYERIAFPLGIQERLRKIKDEKKRKEEALIARQKHIEAKMVNMKQLIAEVQEKIAKKQMIEEEARLIKERKIKEIRQRLIDEGGLTKEKLEKELSMAEKDEKKKKKETKKLKMLERQQRLIKQMTDRQAAAENADAEEGEDAEENKTG